MNAVIRNMFLSKAATKQRYVCPMRPETLKIQGYRVWIAVSK